MNSSTDFARALLRKAADDHYVVQRLAEDAKAPSWILGFHAQQAVEKALKAVLSCHGVEFPRTHNLSMLIELLRRAGHSPPPDGDDLARLIPFGVTLRYEDALGDDELEIDREWAVQAVSRTLRWAGESIGTDSLPTEERD